MREISGKLPGALLKWYTIICHPKEHQLSSNMEEASDETSPLRWISFASIEFIPLTVTNGLGRRWALFR